MSKSKINKVSFGEIQEAIEDIAETFKYKTKLIVGITRGGLVPAVMLSHKMNIPMKTVQIQLRDSTEPLELESLRVYNSRDVLFIDDINDTGETIKLIQEYAPLANFATVHKKKESIIRNAYYHKVVDDWIVYPWEL